MFHRQICFASSLRNSRDKMWNDNQQQTQKTAIQVKRKKPERWQRDMPTNSLIQNILIPQRQLPNGSKDVEHDMGKKKNFINQLRATVGKRFPFSQKTSKKLKLHSNSPPNPVILKENAVPSKHRLLPRTIRGFSYPKVFPKLKRKLSQNEAIQLDVDFVEEHAESVHGTNTVVQARRMTRRISVLSLSPRIQKPPYPAKKKNFPLFKKESMSPVWYHSDMTVGKLQMQVDNLLDNISKKSIQLLALRSAELQQCESLGDKILQSSKQFQRVSLRTTKKRKWKNMCFSCRCCC